ncbi:ATP phosphoribosyltransferase regulatory subunit [bacterium AH-315-P15]|nr:ATP phosphoribosyltransferase regulatory subunit [bacterium AH-315-P15]
MADTSIGGVFEAAGFQRLDTPILQPADVFLDRSGDAIRRRLYMLTDPGGREHCLRPELTIPLARAVIEAGETTARVWSTGLVFRYGGPSRGPSGGQGGGEFTQVGLEHLGGRDAVTDDAEIFALIDTACGLDGACDVRLGDLGVFQGVLNAVDLPAVWRARLRRHFWHAEVFQDLLARLKGERKIRGDENAGLLASIGVLSPVEATRAVHDILKLANIRPVGGRTVEEITARFLEKAQDASNEVVAPGVVKALEAFLRLETTAKDAAGELSKLAAKFGLDLGVALNRLEARHTALAARGLKLGAAHFATAFGRELEYYTGFVFELHAGGHKIAGGGRYDGLMEQLGAPQPITAVGGAIWPARLPKPAKGGAR